MKKYEELSALVLDWADDKDLLHAKNADKQFMKFIEEVFEFKTEVDLWTKVFTDSERKRLEVPQMHNIKMEMGDIFVTLIILCKQLDIDLMECLEMAYEKISKRKGKTVDGIFYKEEDL